MKKVFILVVFLLVLAVWYYQSEQINTVEAEARLSGEISWTVENGADVLRGEELIRIYTLTGEMAAARAPIDGTVKEVLFQVGDHVNSGDIVVKMVK